MALVIRLNNKHAVYLYRLPFKAGGIALHKLHLNYLHVVFM